jgi:hypothetical protein
MILVEPVKLFASILYRDEPIRSEAKELMMRRWGIIDFESESAPFMGNDPRSEELGAPLFRSVVSFTKLVDPGEIALIKIACSSFEERFRHQEKRRIAFDPGYLDLYKVIFTSNKSGGAKIFHSAGIYLDLTLLFVKEKCQALPWSSTEFKNHEYDEAFLAMRELYKKGLASYKPQGLVMPPLPKRR